MDAHQFPVPISTIRDHCRPEEVRYMARVVSCYQDKIRGGGQKEDSDQASEHEGIKLSSMTRIKFRQEGLVQLSSRGREGLLGVSSALIQGYTADSLPWLITVRDKIIRCDTVDEEYVIAIEWEADGLVDWFWKYDVLTERDGSGRLREYVIVTFLTNGAITFISGNVPGLSEEYQETLQTIKIHLPPKTELTPVQKPGSYFGAFGTLISSSPSTVVQDPSAPAPRVVHHNRVVIPKGFNCGLCRPATDGSLVYLLARKKQQDAVALGMYAFWIFVFDWRTRRGFRIRLPEEGTWRKVAGSGHIAILQDWRDVMFTMDLAPEFAKHFSSPTTQDEDENPSSIWRLVDEGLGMRLVHMPFKHQEEANLMPITGNIFQTTGESFCLVSRLGERLYCHLFRRSPPSSEGPRMPLSTLCPGFTHTGSGYVDIDGAEEQLGISFLHKTRGTRSLLGYTGDDGTKRTVHFFVVDFDIDCNQDGSDGLQSIQGRKQELLVRGELQGSQNSSFGSRHIRLSSVGSKVKGVDQILGKDNMQEVFYDGFRGTVGMVNKDYSEIVLLRATRD